MNITSHGIPDAFGNDEHRDIAFYSQTLDSSKSSNYIAHNMKSHSQKVTVTSNKPDHELLTSCKDATDDPFSCTCDDILDSEGSKSLSSEFHSPSLHVNSLLEDYNFSLADAEHDISNTKPNREAKFSSDSVSNETLSVAHQSSEESDIGQCRPTPDMDKPVYVNRTSSISQEVRIVGNSPQLLDEHCSIKNMAQCIHEPVLTNKCEYTVDIQQSCEHMLIHNLSHTLEIYDQQRNASLPYNSVSKNSDCLQPSGHVLKYAVPVVGDARRTNVMTQPEKSGAKGIGYGAGLLCRDSIIDEVDHSQDLSTKISNDVSSNVLRENSFSNADVTISTADSDHYGGASAMEVLPDIVTGTSQYRSSISACDATDSYNVNMYTDAKTTESIACSSSSRGCQRDVDFGVSPGIDFKRVVSSHSKNFDRETETPDQLKHCQVSSMATSEAIHGLKSDKFPGVLNINQLHEGSNMNYELIIQEHGHCVVACDEQDMNPIPHSNDSKQSLELDSSINGASLMTEQKEIGVTQDWIPVSHKLAKFENACNVTENQQKGGKPVPNAGDTPWLSLIETNTTDIRIAQDGKNFKENDIRPQTATGKKADIPSRRTVFGERVLNPLPPAVSPVTVQCKDSFLPPG